MSFLLPIAELLGAGVGYFAKKYTEYSSSNGVDVSVLWKNRLSKKYFLKWKLYALRKSKERNESSNESSDENSVEENEDSSDEEQEFEDEEDIYDKLDKFIISKCFEMSKVIKYIDQDCDIYMRAVFQSWKTLIMQLITARCA
jgi:hypothetical protein